MSDVGGGMDGVGSSEPGGSAPGPSGPPAAAQADPWYRNPKWWALVVLVLLLVGLGAWLISAGGDDDDDVATAGTTTVMPTSTETTECGPTDEGCGDANDPNLDGAEVSDCDELNSEGCGDANDPNLDGAENAGADCVGVLECDLDAARSRWSGFTGARYIMEYSFAGEGEAFYCVEGIAGDPSSVVPFAQGQGCGTSGDPASPDAVLGVEAWFDRLQQWIDEGVLISATYDEATGRPSLADSSLQDGLQVTWGWLDPPA